MNRTAIVTGASRGIGFAIARQLGMDGCSVVLVATGTPEKNQSVLDRLRAEGIDCRYVQADISRHTDRLAIVAQTVAAYGRIDILVINAGVAPQQCRGKIQLGGKILLYRRQKSVCIGR